ncbi:non-specific lipid transfer protein GPI-anchored 4-like [Typha angustifolia]|uniref:non-specific lipid transfer protein GPI-anchored 4-like n=1 Tax=Typha angustifolia TaxID=59011 RepID=UPI003C2CBE41
MAKLIWVATLMAILAFVVFAATASSPSPSPSPSSKCFAGIYDMMDCLDYVIKGSKTTSPGKGCCKGIEKVIGESPDCLCVALVEARSLGVSLNMTRILGLPKACSLKTPPLNNCSGIHDPNCF